MSKKQTPKDTNADDLFKLLDEYRAEYDRLSDDQTPKTYTQADEGMRKTAQEAAEEVEAAKQSEEDMIKHAEQAWSGHFSQESPNADTDSSKELNISAHLSDSVPEAVSEFSEDADATADTQNGNTDGGQDASAESAGDLPDGELPDSDENKNRPWPLKILLSVGSFIWNCGFMVKAAVYVVIVLILSAFLSYYIITVGNDVFAFVKTDKEVTIDVKEGMTRKELSYLLEKDGVIEYSWAFNLFMIYRGDESDSFLAGEHTVSSSMNYSQIIAALTEETYEMIQVSITIPEGYTTDQIIDLLVTNGIGTREGFVDAINNYPYQHEFVELLEEIGYPETRKYRLEGYLYPDTYYFYKDSEEYIVINKILNNFNDKFWTYYESTFKADVDAMGMTFDDIVTLASMVQKEAKLYIDYEYISYVFHNRLNSSDPKLHLLESDATVQYCLPEHVEDLTFEQIHTDNPYNTYLYDGLPPGAICNPGFDALSAAIYPDEPVDKDGNLINAYFFVSNKAGKTYYAMTDAGHTENKKQVEKDNSEDDSE